MSSKREGTIAGTDTYKIDDRRPLGKGAFSVVYSGTKISTDEKVAIKRISLNKISNSEMIVIDREIEIVNMIIELDNPHPNIVRYYEVIKTKMYVYIVMELCADGNLSSLLVKPMKEQFTKHYFSQILNGLMYLQSLGIVHRDVKPDNILLTNDYRTLKLCDFGFSMKLSDCGMSKDIVCGSPIYMAPETLKHESCDKNMDLWAAGMIFYEMVYGYHPCRGIKDIRSIETAMRYVKIIDTDGIDINSEGITLLRRILDVNSRTIITLKGVFNNNWVQENSEVNQIILSNLFHNPHPKVISKSLPKSYNIDRYLGEELHKNKPKTRSYIDPDSNEPMRLKNVSVDRIMFGGGLDDLMKRTTKNMITTDSGYIYEDIKIDDSNSRNGRHGIDTSRSNLTDTSRKSSASEDDLMFVMETS